MLFGHLLFTRPVTLTQSVGNLQTPRIYRVRLVISNTEGIRYSDYQMFTTAIAPLPTVASSTATEDSAHLVAFSSIINPNGSALSVYFQYGPTTAYGSRTPTQTLAAGYNQVPFSAIVNGLVANQLIHYRAVAANSNGISHGPDQTFTKSATAPSGITGTATLVNYKLKLAGVCNPNGSATKVHFEYGQTISLEHSSAEQSIGSGTEPVPVFVSVSELGIVYYRIVASNAQGTIFGQTRGYYSSIDGYAIDDVVTTNAVGKIRINVLGNDTFFPGIASEVKSFTQGAAGSVSINPDQTLNYSPGPHFKGSDRFTYSIAPGPTDLSTATVEVRYFKKLAPGNYVGLLLSEPALHEKCGYIRVTLTNTGGFTGRLQYGRASYPLKGKLSDFAPATSYALRVIPPAKPPFLVDFAVMSIEGYPLRVTITDNDGANVMASVDARRLAFTKSTPCTFAGKYTAALSLDTELTDLTLPTAPGSVAIKISLQGVSRIVGKLGDGRAVSVAGLVDDKNKLPFYSGLYGNKRSVTGSILGNIGFEMVDGIRKCNGLLYWYKHAAASDHLYPAGFATRLDLKGSQ